MEEDSTSRKPLCSCGKELEDTNRKECCSCEAQRLNVPARVVRESRRQEDLRLQASGWELS